MFDVASFNEFDVMCFDIDNTLYSSQSGLVDAIRERIIKYVMNVMSISKPDALEIIYKWKKKYTSTLGGLINETGTDKAEYLKYIHNININDYVQPNKELLNLLNSISVPKIIITNSSRDYADRILFRLGIKDKFAVVYCTEDMGYQYKNNDDCLNRIIRIACNHLGINPIVYERIMMIDDDSATLKIAHQLGIKTVLVSSEVTSFVDHSISNICDLDKVFGVKIDS